MPKGIYERDPLDKDHLSTGISLGQVQAKLEKEFAELEEKKKIRAEIDSCLLYTTDAADE